MLVWKILFTFLIILKACCFTNDFITQSLQQIIGDAIEEAYLDCKQLLQRKEKYYLFDATQKHTKQKLTFSDIVFQFHYVNQMYSIQYLAIVNMDLILWQPRIITFVWHTGYLDMVEYVNVDD